MFAVEYEHPNIKSQLFFNLKKLLYLIGIRGMNYRWELNPVKVMFGRGRYRYTKKPSSLLEKHEPNLDHEFSTPLRWAGPLPPRANTISSRVPLQIPPRPLSTQKSTRKTARNVRVFISFFTQHCGPLVGLSRYHRVSGPWHLLRVRNIYRMHGRYIEMIRSCDKNATVTLPSPILAFNGLGRRWIRVHNSVAGSNFAD